MGARNEWIQILTDNKSSLKASDAIEIKSKSVHQCQQFLNTLAVHNTLELCWVEGHNDSEGNIEADSLARRAALSNRSHEISTPLARDTLVKTF